MSRFAQRERRGSTRAARPAFQLVAGCEGALVHLDWSPVVPQPLNIEVWQQVDGGGFGLLVTIDGADLDYTDVEFICPSAEVALDYKIRGLWPDPGPFSNVASTTGDYA